MDDAAPRLAEPEDAPPRVSRRWLMTCVLLLVAVPALLSGPRMRTVGVARAEGGEAVAEPAESEIPADEWIRLVGAAPAPVVDLAPPRPQWGVLMPEPGDVPVAQQLLAGDVQSLDLGGVPVELGRLVRMYDAANGRAQLAAAGGEVRLVGGDLPPWMWGSTSAVPTAQARQPFLVTLPPALDGGARASGLGAWIDGVYYGDPTGVGLPLRRAGGFEDHLLSDHFSVRDFQTRDGAPYARIAAELVAGLEGVRDELGPVTVISGYRHPAYNARSDVKGDRYSRHQSGQAADVWSSTRTSVEIAHAAIQRFGCGIGLGLGRNTVHIDVRGYLATWTYPGAPLSEAVFDRWVLGLCGGVAPEPPAFPRRFSNDEWFALAAEGVADDGEVVHLTEEAVEEAVAEAEAPPARLSVNRLVQRDLSDLARARFLLEGPGIVVVDLRDGAVPEGPALVARARYVRAALPEARRLGLGGLQRWVAEHPPGSHFVYAVRLPGGEVLSGVASTAPFVLPPALPSGPRSDAGAPDSARAAVGAGLRPVLPPVSEPSAPRAWILVVASRPTLEAGDREVAYYQTLLSASGLPVALNVDGYGDDIRYRVAVGPFASREEALAAEARLRPYVATEVEVVRLGG